jgi:hypothetical protein
LALHDKPDGVSRWVAELHQAVALSTGPSAGIVLMRQARHLRSWPGVFCWIDKTGLHLAKLEYTWVSGDGHDPEKAQRLAELFIASGRGGCCHRSRGHPLRPVARQSSRSPTAIGSGG